MRAIERKPRTFFLLGGCESYRLTRNMLTETKLGLSHVRTIY